MKKQLTEIVLICVVGFFAFAPGLWTRDLWHPLEPRYAQTSFEIVERGEWAQLYLNGVPYYNKPPVFFWLNALSIEAFGKSVAAVRLPTLVFALGSLVLCYFLARRLRIDPVAPSLILASTYAYALTAQGLSIDVPLTFFILFFFYCYMRSREGDSAPWWFAGACLALAAAVLTKGPVALLTAACAVVPWAAYRGEWREILNWKWLAVGGTVILCGLGWLMMLALGEESFGQIVGIMLGREVGTRFIIENPLARPFYFYIVSFFFEGFMPWSLLLPFAIVYVWKKRRSEPLFGVLLWFGVAFLIFSLIPAKAGRYILPLYPAAALVTGEYAARVRNRIMLVPLIAIPLVGAGSLIGAMAGQKELAEYGVVLGIALMSAGFLGLINWRKYGYAALSLGMVAGIFAFSAIRTPYRDEVKSPRPLAEFLLKHGAGQDDVVWLRSIEVGVNFDAGFTHTTHVEELSSVEYAKKWVLVLKRDVAELPEEYRHVEPVQQFVISRKKYLVYAPLSTQERPNTPESDDTI